MKKYYHVTDAMKGMIILKEGLKPFIIVGNVPITSQYSNPNYVYLFGDMKSSKIYAEVLSYNTQFPIWILEIKLNKIQENRLERDFEGGMQHFSSYKFKGIVSSNQIKVIIKNIKRKFEYMMMR